MKIKPFIFADEKFFSIWFLFEIPNGIFNKFILFFCLLFQCSFMVPNCGRNVIRFRCLISIFVSSKESQKISQFSSFSKCQWIFVDVNYPIHRIVCNWFCLYILPLRKRYRQTQKDRRKIRNDCGQIKRKKEKYQQETTKCCGKVYLPERKSNFPIYLLCNLFRSRDDFLFPFAILFFICFFFHFCRFGKWSEERNRNLQTACTFIIDTVNVFLSLCAFWFLF